MAAVIFRPGANTESHYSEQWGVCPLVFARRVPPKHCGAFSDLAIGGRVVGIDPQPYFQVRR